MRIAFISDIHGNLVALETVLDELAADSYDRLIFLGDAAAIGPQPHEVLSILAELGCPCIMGNTDAALLGPLAWEDQSRPEPIFMDQFRWGQAQLTPGDAAFIKTFKPTLELELDRDTKLICVHGSPRSYEDVILAATAEEELRPMLSGSSATIMAGGHTHTQMVRRFEEWLLFNPGSVGLPVEWRAGQMTRPPWAEYGFITHQNGRLAVNLKRTPLDVAAVCQAAATSDFPSKEGWIAAWRTGR